MVKNKKIRLTLLLFILILNSCALQLPPEGGEIDLIPPKIISSFPENGTVNYSENYFKVTFSEYVDKRSFRESIFISPSVDGEMKIDWSGKTAEVIFTKGFKENTTYIITIGTDVVDLNNKNRMASAFNLRFSTGDQIDFRTINGKIFDKEKEGVMIFTYKFENDTTNYLLKKPDYISQCGKDGSFLTEGLPSGKFRIFAIKDQYRDLIFQSEQDLVGIPSQDIFFSETDTSFSNFNFYLTRFDTIPPKILEARMLDDKHILIKFTEELQLERLSLDNFKFLTFNDIQSSGVSAYFNTVGKLNELILVPENNFTNKKEIRLFVKDIYDLSGNVLELDSIDFITTDKVDTSSIKLIKTEPTELKLDHQNFDLKFFFDDAIQKNNLPKAFSFWDSNNNKIPMNISFINDATVQILPIQKLKPDSRYRVEIDMNYLLDFNGNKIDSVIKIDLLTKGDYEFSGISGRVITKKQNLVLFLESEAISNIKYYSSLNEKNEFEFERIPPGKYLLGAFEDQNKNSKYDFGSLIPFKFSEKFYYYPSIIEIKPRWSVSDIQFVIE
ncbi:MAG: Ig-like domain-containing protein [Ignavibacterium sp.]|nr:Ig-like domain-containing protein [Ignavibacterium sp.]MDW8375442.1 Ig-like domain-containing protein [Ignavibacteriales bacterium]